MEFFRIHKTIPFLKYRHILNGISLVSFLIAVYWIFTRRPRTPNRCERT